MRTRVLFVSGREKKWVRNNDICEKKKPHVTYTFSTWESRLVIGLFWFSFRGRKKETVRLWFPLHIWILNSPKTCQQQQSLMLRSFFIRECLLYLNTRLTTEVAFPMDVCCIFILIFHHSPGYSFDCIDFGDR